MTTETSKRDSKFLSLVLRHEPQRAHLTLGPGGWVDIKRLLAGMAQAGHPLSHESLLQIVAENDKKRFTLSEDGRQIRAAQGHSIPVDLGLQPAVPPAILWHGTAEKSLAAILHEGLSPQSRQHVHLSKDQDTALRVGQRHGKPVILEVATDRMQADGHLFWQADNGVWLTDSVPPAYLRQLS